jgi:hypothetical protein
MQEEANLINNSQIDLLTTDEQRTRFIGLWSTVKDHFEQVSLTITTKKLKTDSYLLETLIRCTCFIAHTHDIEESGERNINIYKFIGCTRSEGLSHQHQVTLSGFIKYLKKIIEILPNDSYPKILKDILSDYGICHLLFEKFENFFNIFFSNK